MEDFILATASHLAGDAAGDKAWFLDFDLAVLGAEEGAYERYADNIRKVRNIRSERHVSTFSLCEYGCCIRVEDQASTGSGRSVTCFR